MAAKVKTRERVEAQPNRPGLSDDDVIVLCNVVVRHHYMGILDEKRDNSITQKLKNVKDAITGHSKKQEAEEVSCLGIGHFSRGIGIFEILRGFEESHRGRSKMTSPHEK